MIVRQARYSGTALQSSLKGSEHERIALPNTSDEGWYSNTKDVNDKIKFHEDHVTVVAQVVFGPTYVVAINHFDCRTAVPWFMSN